MSEVRVHLGSVVFGQSRDIAVPIDEKQYNKLRLELNYQSAHGDKNKQCTEVVKLPADVQALQRQKHRLEFVHHVRSGYTLLTEGSGQATDNQKVIVDKLEALANAIQSHAADDQYLTDLHTDLTGQVKEAFSRMDWFRKWGTHYLLSITRTSVFLALANVPVIEAIDCLFAQAHICCSNATTSKIPACNITDEANCSAPFVMKWTISSVAYPHPSVRLWLTMMAQVPVRPLTCPRSTMPATPVSMVRALSSFSMVLPSSSKTCSQATGSIRTAPPLATCCGRSFLASKHVWLSYVFAHALLSGMRLCSCM